MSHKNTTTAKTVKIEVTEQFGKANNITPNWVWWDKAYGTRGFHYDVEVKEGSDFWVACLYHQVRMTIENLTFEEFKSLKWLHAKVPTGLGSNRISGHSAFDWAANFKIARSGNQITLNGDKVYSMTGKYLGSNMEAEIYKATPRIPKGFPGMIGEENESGTTVTLWQEGEKFTALLNTVVKSSPDIGKIEKKYKVYDNINWSKKIIHVVYPEKINQLSLFMKEWEGNNHWEYNVSFWVYFPNSDKYIEVGKKKAYALLQEAGVEVPKKVMEILVGHKVEGDGWKFIG